MSPDFQPLAVVFPADLGDPLRQLPQRIGHKPRKIYTEGKQDEKCEAAGQTEQQCCSFYRILSGSVFPYNCMHIDIIDVLQPSAYLSFYTRLCLQRYLRG